MQVSRIALAVALATTALAAQAGPSSHSFAWTHEVGSAVLTINGGLDITATNRGWVDSTGGNNFGGAAGNYIVGVCGSSDACGGSDLEVHNYFAFDLGRAGNIDTAVLKLYQPSDDDISGSGRFGFLAAGPLTYTLWDTLLNPTADSGVALYDDLGGGVSYGSVVIDSTSNGTTVSITLNGAGVAMLQAASDSSGMAYIGGAVNAVPEPGTYVLMAAGLAAIGLVARRRRPA